MWKYNYTDELQHHGVPGMKWGVRRYQSKSGKLTPLGRKRYSAEGKEKAEIKATAKTNTSSSSSQKSVKDMTNEELKSVINRLEMEKRYRELNPQKVSLGKQFVEKAVIPAVMEAGKDIIKSQVTNTAKKVLEKEKKK